MGHQLRFSDRVISNWMRLDLCVLYLFSGHWGHVFWVLVVLLGAEKEQTLVGPGDWNKKHCPGSLVT